MDKRSYIKKWRLNNPDKVAGYYSKYKKLHKDSIARSSKKYRENHPDNISQSNKRWCLKNKQYIRARQKKYEKSQRVFFLEKVRLAKRIKDKKYRSTPHGVIRHRVSNGIIKKLKIRLTNKRGGKTFSFLPYTVDQLKEHLEKQFKSGMSWNNHGKWHIDHIKPDSSFNYKSVEDPEFQKCWALNNLQPLWAIENLKKSKKY